MFGGVGPSSDIRLQKEEEDTYKTGFHKDGTTQKQKPQPPRGFFTFQQLNALAVIIILSASGMVSVEDFAFVVFSLVYMYFISKVAFPNVSYPPQPVFGQRNRILSLYVFIGALVGLFFPIAYIFEGIFEGDKEGIKAAAPHVFLLASQLFMEGVSLSGRFSLPIRVFVPVFYNSRRIFTLVEWLRGEIYKVELEYGGNPRRLYIGRALAVANMAFWCFNLFGFLLPVYLPKAFKIFMEGVAFYGGFSLPVFAFVPVFYNSRRIFTVVEWLRCEFHMAGGGGTGWRIYFGRGLAVSNMVFWCFNLFGFLLPVFLPRVFKLYYSGHKRED